LSLAPDQIPALPDQLAGTRVLLRLAPGTTGPEWAAALLQIRRRGGVPGVHLTGVPGDDDPAIDAGGDSLILDVAGEDPDRLAFELKRALTLARGRHAAMTLAIAAAPGLAEALRQRGIASYIDTFLPVADTIQSPDDLLTPIAPGGVRFCGVPPRCSLGCRPGWCRSRVAR
jgi:hypothetical protein